MHEVSFACRARTHDDAPLQRRGSGVRRSGSRAGVLLQRGSVPLGRAEHRAPSVKAVPARVRIAFREPARPRRHAGATRLAPPRPTSGSDGPERLPHADLFQRRLARLPPALLAFRLRHNWFRL